MPLLFETTCISLCNNRLPTLHLTKSVSVSKYTFLLIPNKIMDPSEMKKNSDYWNINEIKKLTG